MNLAFVNSSKDWGGGEVWLEQIAGGLAARGHSVTVICREGSALAGRAPAPGTEKVAIRFSGDFNPFTVRTLYRLLTLRHVNLVCTNWEKELRLCSLAAAPANIRVVPSREVDRPIADSAANRLFYGRLASGILYNSHATKRTVTGGAPWLASKASAVVWKGVDAAAYANAAPAALRESIGAGAEDVLCGFVGRLDEQKGIVPLLEAVRHLVAELPSFRLIVAGSGPQGAEAESFIEHHGLAAKIHLLGFRSDIPAILKAVDFLAMPSAWEGFGYAAVEAMAAGKAVVATRTSSLPEIVEDGRSGLLVAPGSIDELAGALRKLASDRPLRERLGRNGQERASTLFTIDRMVDETASFFSSIVDGRHTTA